MKISKSLPQFERSATLIITTGTERGKIYFAFKSEITKLTELKISAKKFSDREGFSAKRGKGNMFVSGSSNEIDKHAAVKEFSKELAGKIKAILAERPVKHIILLCPEYAENIIQEPFPAGIKKKIIAVIPGAFHELPALKLLEVVQKHFPVL